MPITRVNLDFHEISREKTLSQLQIITNTQSQSPVTITCCNTVLSAAPRSYSSASSSPIGNVSPDPRSSSMDSDVEEEKKKARLRTRSGWKKKWTRSRNGRRKRLLYSRECPREYAKWKSGGERGRGEREGRRRREVHLTPKHLRALARWCTVRESVVCRLLCFDPRTSARLVCVCDDPTGPVFWPRLTRALGACSPRSHPSGHALFHPGERIVRLASSGASGARHRSVDALRRRASSTSRGRSPERWTVVDVPRGWTQGGRYRVRERIGVGQDLIGSGAGDCLGAGRTVAPRNAKRRKPACWNARVVTPTRAPATPSIHGHEDTDRTTPRDGSLYQVSEISVTSTGWSERRVVLRSLEDAHFQLIGWSDFCDDRRTYD